MTAVVLAPSSAPSSPPSTAAPVESPSQAKKSRAFSSIEVDCGDSTSNQIDPIIEESKTRNINHQYNGEDVENIERRGNGEADDNQCSPSSSTKNPTSEPKLKKKRSRVSFESADIVEFEPTIYTTSVTSGGIPVGMSLKERSRSRRRLDSFELERKDMRVGRQNYMEEGYLDPQEREVILNNAGCEEPTMATVEAEVNRIIAHRRESNEIDFEFMYGLGEISDSVGESNEQEEEEEYDDEEEVEEEEEEEHDELEVEETEQQQDEESDSDDEDPSTDWDAVDGSNSNAAEA